MSDMTLAKRVGATLAAFAVAGGLAVAGSGAAFAAPAAPAAPAAGNDTCGVPGNPTQAKDTTKIHMLVPESPAADAATMTSGVPMVGTATEGADCHLRGFHSVALGDYAQNNIEDPVGYSGGTHIDMTEDMLGMPGAFDKEQEMLGATPKPEFQMQH